MRARRPIYRCTLLPNGVRGHLLLSDLAVLDGNVRYQGQPGRHLLRLSFSQFDPNRSFQKAVP
jgi:hypothetical protein